MELTFYKQAATPNRVDKSDYLTVVGTVSNVVLKDDTNLMSPTFILKTSEKVYNSNYVYCSFTHRYYYINNIDALSGGRLAIHCSIDVLYTYKDEILNSSAWIERSDTTTDMSDDYDMLHNDYPFRQDYETRGIDFADGDRVFEQQNLTRNILFIIK